MSDAPIVSVSCGSDHAYFCGLWVTLHSLCAHASPEAALVLHVLDGGLDERPTAAPSPPCPAASPAAPSKSASIPLTFPASTAFPSGAAAA